MVFAISQGMHSRDVYILLPSPKTGDFFTYSYSGGKANHTLFFPANSLITLTMKYQDNIIDCNDMDTVPVLNTSDSDKDTLKRNHIELLVPLKSGEGMVGMLLIGSKLSGEPYSAEDRSLLQTVSNEVAGSIKNARLYESMNTERKALRKVMGGIIHAMKLTIESRDPYTGGHQQRVSDLAFAIAGEMRLSEWDMEGIRITALVHDIGKLAVPTDILSKPGRISHDEFSIIKNHPKVGYEILKGIDFPWPVAQAILQHHERLDGSGYPDGLHGEDIILAARILGVADVVEAMSSHRPYRPALGLEKALEEISKGKGTLYDPEVVDACVEFCQKTGGEFEQLIATSSKQYVYA